MSLASVRATTRLWLDDGRLAAFAFINDFNSLRFEIDAGRYPGDSQGRSTQLENEIVDWGLSCIRKRNAESGQQNTLEACFSQSHGRQIAMLERNGFTRTGLRTLIYARSLRGPVASHAFPPGFSLRPVAGEREVEALVALHRAAFGTQYMTVEHRLAIMRGPSYQRELDLLAVGPGGVLAAFCICDLIGEAEAETVGFADVVGTHPDYQKRGLGKAIVTAGLQQLQSRGATAAKLSTSSDNIPMQRLAQSLGFNCELEKFWFSKEVA